MNNRDRKRHEQRKARRQAAEWGTEPGLKGTKMLVLPLDDGPQVRRIEIDATDPVDAIVRWGRRALLQDAPDELVRVVTFSNWNDDPRELYEIPEARAYARRLWAEAKPLLRLLSESTYAPLPDDSYGLSPPVFSSLGLGWFDVYTLGFCDWRVEEKLEHEIGPVRAVSIGGMSDEKRAALRESLVEITSDHPGGAGFDVVSERATLTENHRDKLAQMARHLLRSGEPDTALFVVSLLDDIGRTLAVQLCGNDAVRETLAVCEADDMHPAAVAVCPRAAAAKGLHAFAPQASAKLAEQLRPGEFWVVTVAAGGTQVGRIFVEEEAQL